MRANHVKLYTTDICIVDIVVEITPEIQALLDARQFTKEGKFKITKEDLSVFFSAINGLPQQIFPGGSASNTTRTIQKLGGRLVESIFLGSIGQDVHGQMIRESFKDFGVTLHEPDYSGEVEPDTAISFVFKYPDGQRTIVTYPGNANKIIQPKHIQETQVEKASHVLLQGSIRTPEKLGADVTDTILKYRWDYHKQLILCLPTSAFQPEYFKWLSASSNILLSNTDELGFMFAVPVKDARNALEKKPESENLKQALRRNVVEALSRLQTRQNDVCNRILEKAGFAPQVAMITDGAYGAYVVEADDITHIPGISDEKIKKVNMLGAGDNSFAGFIYAKTVLGMNNISAAQFAMQIAAAKIGYNGPVMEDPIAELTKIAPYSAQAVEIASKGRALTHS